MAEQLHILRSKRFSIDTFWLSLVIYGSSADAAYCYSQLPAYEWNFGDVNPPVHAWATFRTFKIERKLYGRSDLDFLERVCRFPVLCPPSQIDSVGALKSTQGTHVPNHVSLYTLFGKKAYAEC